MTWYGAILLVLGIVSFFFGFGWGVVHTDDLAGGNYDPVIIFMSYIFCGVLSPLIWLGYGIRWFVLRLET